MGARRGNAAFRFIGGILSRESCWLWNGYISKSGYGKFGLRKNKTFVAARFSYELFIAPIPAGLTIDHLCRNTRCVNPDHLEAVSIQENLKRAYDLRKSEVCREGHPYDYFPPSGGRFCKRCRAKKFKAWIRKTRFEAVMKAKIR